MNKVRRGTAKTQAMTLGTTRNLNESIERDSTPSICSVALMLASTAPMPDPTRPANSNPTTKGPISTKKARDCTVGISAVAPNMTSVLRVWRVITAPTAKPEATTSGTDLAPTSASCLTIWLPSNGRRKKSFTTRSPNTLNAPTNLNNVVNSNAPCDKLNSEK